MPFRSSDEQSYIPTPSRLNSLDVIENIENEINQVLRDCSPSPTGFDHWGSCKCNKVNNNLLTSTDIQRQCYQFCSLQCYLSLTCKVESEQFSKNSRSDIICVPLREREYSDGSQIVVKFSSDKHLLYILGLFLKFVP